MGNGYLNRMKENPNRSEEFLHSLKRRSYHGTDTLAGRMSCDEKMIVRICSTLKTKRISEFLFVSFLIEDYILFVKAELSSDLASSSDESDDIHPETPS